jgi:hypothetical protein
MELTTTKQKNPENTVEIGIKHQSNPIFLISIYFFSGYFCPAGTIVQDQFPCPPGSYTNSTNLTSADECSTCPLGMYCDWASGKVTYTLILI